MKGKIITQFTADGKLTAVILNEEGKPIAELTNPVQTGEEVLVRAWKFAEEHPELFQKGGENDVMVE
jgi:hypothetical protein